MLSSIVLLVTYLRVKNKTFIGQVTVFFIIILMHLQVNYSRELPIVYLFGITSLRLTWDMDQESPIYVTDSHMK